MTEVAACCDIDFSMVARHLATMARAGLLSSEKQGRTTWYAADAESLALMFRELADSIDEIRPVGCVDIESGCGCTTVPDESEA